MKCGGTVRTQHVPTAPSGRPAVVRTRILRVLASMCWSSASSSEVSVMDLEVVAVMNETAIGPHSIISTEQNRPHCVTGVVPPYPARTPSASSGSRRPDTHQAWRQTCAASDRCSAFSHISMWAHLHGRPHSIPAGYP
eukprot:325760-Rhodomonas_salina.2